ncbi:glycosyltransferase [Tenacibaculum halocynthiae]|uniref:glycosyltransferase n=1 Tax=Tenacibaculum halocynthiae TaxID=1254437 RepID=UPI003D657FBE
MNENTVILKPISSTINGQTNRMNSVHAKLGIKILPAFIHNITEISKFKNIIIFDPEDRDIFKIIEKLPRKRIISHFHLNPTYLGLNSELWKTSLTILNRSDIIIVPADFLKVELEKYINREIITVPNGVDTEIFKIKNNVSLPQTFGFVGKLTNSKGLQILKYIWRNFPSNYRIQIDSVNNELLINTNNKILSNQSLQRENHITPFLDCLISTSLSEVAPLVIIEALVAGVPVITTNSSPYIDELQKVFSSSIIQKIILPDTIKNLNKDELKLNKQEVKQLSEVFIEKIITMPKLNKTEKEAIRKKALEIGFSSDKMCYSFATIYQGH